jgi:hypothetical protein
MVCYAFLTTVFTITYAAGARGAGLAQSFFCTCEQRRNMFTTTVFCNAATYLDTAVICIATCGNSGQHAFGRVPGAGQIRLWQDRD